MQITWTDSILGIFSQGQSHGMTGTFLQLPQYKLSGPITQLWYELGS